jgi:hypothetical protein
MSSKEGRLSRQPIPEIEEALRRCGCPQEYIDRHLAKLKQLRQIKRKRLIKVWEGNRLQYRIAANKSTNDVM